MQRPLVPARAAAGKGSPWHPPLFGAGAEYKARPGRPRVTTGSWATCCRLYLHKLVDFPPQLKSPAASETAFEFLVGTNQWTTRKTTKTTTKETVSECYLQIHIVFKEKPLAERKPTARQGKKFLLQHMDLCKTTNRSGRGVLLIAYGHIYLF